MIAQLDRGFIRRRPTKLWARLVAYVFFEGRPATTSMQWLNHIVFLVFRVVSLLPISRVIDNPVFIVGMGRSGTTALGSVLSIHPQLGYLNEPKALWHFVNSDDDVIGSYSEMPGKYRFSLDKASAEMFKKINKVYGAFLRITYSERVLDKYPEMLFRVDFVKKLFPNAKFILIVRNGLDNCLSVDNWCEKHGNGLNSAESQDWWGVANRKWELLVEQIASEQDDFKGSLEILRNLQCNLDKAVLEWILTMREGLEAFEKYPDSILNVTYENICSNSTEEVKRILDFLEISQDDVVKSYAQDTFSRSTPAVQSLEVHPILHNPFVETLEALNFATTGVSSRHYE